MTVGRYGSTFIHDTVELRIKYLKNEFHGRFIKFELFLFLTCKSSASKLHRHYLIVKGPFGQREECSVSTSYINIYYCLKVLQSFL